MDDVIFEEFKGTGNMEPCSTESWPTAAFSRPSTWARADAQGRAILQPEVLGGSPSCVDI